MRKLINGIVEFRRNVQKGYKEKFGRLSVGQSPNALFIACSDSRVVPNTFASTDPGDLFVIRNVGNMIPKCGRHGVSTSDGSEAAAIEFSILDLSVTDVIVCGHSECGAMDAIINNKVGDQTHNLNNWLRHGHAAFDRLNSGFTLDPLLSRKNQLSQINVLEQMESLKSYPAVEKRLEEGKLRIHGWWFDIKNADVYSYSKIQGKFVIIDEEEAKRILSLLNN